MAPRLCKRTSLVIVSEREKKIRVPLHDGPEKGARFSAFTVMVLISIATPKIYQ